MPVDDAGLASGLFNTSQQVGGALGLAILSTIAASTTADALSGAGADPTNAEQASALVDGFHAAWLGSAGFLALGAVMLFTLLRRGDVLAVAEGDPPRSSRSPRRVEIAPFRIEQYYAVHEFTAPFMLSSSDAESVAVMRLLELEQDATERLLGQHLGYTESPGAPELRAAIAAIYDTTEPEDTLVVAAAEEAIFLAYHALLEPGDHVVVETPCYESALQVAHSAGAEVTEWRRAAADGWAHDLEALERALRPETKFVYVNTPHNPTGLLMSRDVLERVVELCAERGAWLFCDEVYRELEHDPRDRPPAACDLYERALSLGSMSKTYGLPGLRLGWLASRDRAALARIVDLKHYTTICSSAPSELLSALALRHRDVLAGRNRGIVLSNLPLLDAFLDRQGERLSWTRPTASPIGFARVHGVEDTNGFCERLVAEAGVLLLPGEVYDEPGHVRIGYGRSTFAEALGLFERWLDLQS